MTGRLKSSTQTAAALPFGISSKFIACEVVDYREADRARLEATSGHARPYG
jgi:hypothetical protein